MQNAHILKGEYCIQVSSLAAMEYQNLLQGSCAAAEGDSLYSVQKNGFTAEVFKTGTTQISPLTMIDVDRHTPERMEPWYSYDTDCGACIYTAAPDYKNSH